MPVVYPDCDERYPDWDLLDKPLGGWKMRGIELTPAEYADFCRVQAEYQAWQDRITDLMGKPNESA